MPALPRPHRAELPDRPLSPPSGGETQGAGAEHAALTARASGLYVASIVNNRAILRGPASAASAAPAGGLPPMAPTAGVASVATAPRLVTYTVRDGESFFFESREVTAQITGKSVVLYYRSGGKNQLVFRGELDSIAPAAAVKPVAAELVPRNAEFIQQRSVSTMTFSAGVAIGPSAASTTTSP